MAKYVTILVIDTDQAPTQGTSTPFMWDWNQLVGPEVVQVATERVKDDKIILEYDPKTSLITGLPS